jgi:hypothetical protein
MNMKMEHFSFWEYVGGLASDCHGRLGQDDEIEVEEEDEFDGSMD